MNKQKRKKRPEPPYHFWLDTDGCWFCKYPNGCSGCKVLKQYVHKQRSNRKKERDLKRIFDNY